MPAMLLTTPVGEISAFFLPDGQESNFELAIEEWDWGPEVEKILKTHSLSGGIQAVDPGIFAGDGRVSASYNMIGNGATSGGYLIHDPAGPNINPGVRGRITFGLNRILPGMVGYTGTGIWGSPDHYFQISVMILKVNFQGRINNKVMYDFNCCIDSTYLNPYQTNGGPLFSDYFPQGK